MLTRTGLVCLNQDNRPPCLITPAAVVGCKILTLPSSMDDDGEKGYTTMARC